MAQQSGGGGIGLAGATFIVFLALKLTEHIDWSWWWVTAPLWIPPLAVLAIIGIGAACVGFFKMLDWLFSGREFW